MNDATRSEPQRLSTHELFTAGNTRVHVNTPSHDGDIPLHDHDFFECALVVAGQGLHRDLSGQRPARPGMVVWLPPGQWHSWEQCHHLQLMNLCLSADLLDHELAWCVDHAQLGTLWSGSEIRCWHIDASISQRLQTVMHAIQHSPNGEHLAAIGHVLISLELLATSLPPRNDNLSPTR